jgi:phosphate transport system permease protein
MSMATNEKRVIPKSAQFNSGDRLFNRAVTIAAFTSLAVLAGIAIFLGLQMIPVVQEQGLFFIFGSDWQMSSDVAGGEGARAGIWPMVWGSILISPIGLIIAVPTSLLLAIFIVFLVDRNSLFQRRGRAPDKSAEKH